MIKKILVTVMALGMLFCTGCFEDRSEPEEIVELYDNSWIMEHYMDSIRDYDHVVYEQVYFEWGTRSIGPTEYRFRGIVYLTEEEADRLWDAYEWEETDAPAFEFDKIDAETAGEGPWYSCQQFEKDNYPAVLVSYAVFDGEKIVFDISQV